MGLAHLSFLFLITCGDIYKECNYAKTSFLEKKPICEEEPGAQTTQAAISAVRHCVALWGLDKTTIEGMYVAI